MADQESFRNGSSASVHCYQRDGRTQRHTPLRPFVAVWPGTTPAPNGMRLPCRITAASDRAPARCPKRSYLAHTPRVPSINTADHAALRGTTRGIETPSGFRDCLRVLSHVAIAVTRGADAGRAKLPLRRTFRNTVSGVSISPYEHTSSGYPQRHQPFAVRLPVSEYSYCLKPCLAFGPVELSYSLTLLFRTPPDRSRSGCTRRRVAGSLAPAHVERRQNRCQATEPHVGDSCTTFDNLGLQGAYQSPQGGISASPPLGRDSHRIQDRGCSLNKSSKDLVRSGSVRATQATLMARGSKG